MSKIERIFLHEKMPSRRLCLRCKNRALLRLGDGRLKCNRCGYKFSLRTKTYLSRSRLGLDQWYELLWWFAYEFTANKTARELGVDQKLVHRCFSTIRKAIYDYEVRQLKKFMGEVEADETYVGAKFKNRRKRSRDKYRKINAVKRGRGSKILNQPVFGLYQRNGFVYVEFVDDVGKKTLQDIIKGKISLESEIYTDTWGAYKGLDKKGYKHETVNHGNEEYVKYKNKKKVHINGIEGFWGYMKERLMKHHGVSKDNLIYYVKECEFRFNNRKFSTDDFLQKIIRILMNSSPPND